MLVAAVFRNGVIFIGSREGCQGGEEVDLRHQGIGDTAFHLPGPVDDKGYSGNGFEGAVLPAPERTPGAVVAQLLHCLIHISVIQHRTVVTGDHDQRVVIDSCLLQCTYDLTYRPVELNDGITAVPHAGGTPKPLVRVARHMDVVGAEIEEEGFLPVSLDEAHGMDGDAVSNRFILPERIAASRHVTDTGDAVHDALVVTMVGAGLQFGQ